MDQTDPGIFVTQRRSDIHEPLVDVLERVRLQRDDHRFKAGNLRDCTLYIPLAHGADLALDLRHDVSGSQFLKPPGRDAVDTQGVE